MMGESEERKEGQVVNLDGWCSAGVNPREQPFLSDAILPTLKDDSLWTQVTKRANNIHTWSGIAARQSLVRHKLGYSHSKLWFCWQFLSRRCPLFKYIFHCACCLTDTSVQPRECINTCMHVHVNVNHVWVYSICLPKSEPVPPKGKPVEPATFPLTPLSDAAQLLPAWFLNGLGSNVPSCPSSAHQHTPVTQPGSKVSIEPTANTRAVTLEKFPCLLWFTFTETCVSLQSCETNICLWCFTSLDIFRFNLALTLFAIK